MFVCERIDLTGFFGGNLPILNPCCDQKLCEVHAIVHLFSVKVRQYQLDVPLELVHQPRVPLYPRAVPSRLWDHQAHLRALLIQIPQCQVRVQARDLLVGISTPVKSTN